MDKTATFQAIAAKIDAWFEKNPYEIEWGYDSKFSTEQIEELLRGEWKDVMEDIIEESYLWDNEDYWELIDNCIKEVFELEEVSDELSEELRDTFCIFPPINANIHQLDNWPVNLVFDLKLEMIQKHYYDMEECEEECEFFNVNPASLLEWTDGGPADLKDMPERNGNEYVDPHDLFTDWGNCFYSSGYYALLGGRQSLIGLSKLIEENPTGKYVITLHKGTYILSHDYLNGAGGIGFELKRDMTIEFDDIERLYVDSGSYGIDGVHGLAGDVWQDFSLKADVSEEV